MQVIKKILIFSFLSFLLPGDYHASEVGAHLHEHLHIDGSNISLLWIIPFIGILLSIAILPIVMPKYWHHNYGKVSAFSELPATVSLRSRGGVP